MDQHTATIYSGLMDHLKSKIADPEFMKRHRSNKKAFTRRRCLTFVTMVVFLLNMLKHALQDELDEYFKVLTDREFSDRQVTKSAFSQARQKLKHSAFIELNRDQVNYFYDHFEWQRWRGKRLVAMDGSLTDLPNTPVLQEHFGYWQPAAGGRCAKARISQMFDVLNKVSLDALIMPKENGERVLAAHHCQHLTQDDLVLLDRGYPAFWLFSLIRQQQAHFCARMSVSEWGVVQEFVASGQAEQIVDLHPCYNARQACQQRNLPTTPLPVRLVRLDGSEPDEPLVLALSLLDQVLFPFECLAELYPHRWPVETDYSYIKLLLEVENWTGSSVEAIYQDFHATVFSKNLAAIISRPAQQHVSVQSQSRKYRYQVNMANLFSKMKDTLVSLFFCPNPVPFFQFLWRQMTQTIEPIRPGRSFPRKKRVKPKRFSMNRKSLR